MIPLLALQKPTPDVRTYTLCRYVLCVHHERDSCSRASQCQSLFLSGFASNTCRSQTGRGGREQHGHALLILCSWAGRVELAEPGKTESRPHPAEADETPNRIEVICS